MMQANTSQSSAAQFDASPSNNAPTNAAPPNELAEATANLRSEVDRAFTALRRSFYVERQALGLSLFDAAVRASIFAGLGLIGLALSITATILGVVAARQGLNLLFDGAWWSDLVLAALLMGIVAAAVAIVSRSVHKGVLARTKRALAEGPLKSTSTERAS